MGRKACMRKAWNKQKHCPCKPQCAQRLVPAAFLQVHRNKDFSNASWYHWNVYFPLSLTKKLVNYGKVGKRICAEQRHCN